MKSHELLKADRVLGIEIQQLLRHGGELQALLHNLDRDEERGRDLLVRHPALLAQRPERAKLVQRMQRRALDVLGQRVFLGCRAVVALHDAGDPLCFAQALRLDEPLQGPKAPPTRRDLEQPGLGARSVKHRPDVQALDQAAPADVFGQVFETDASLDLAGHWRRSARAC